MYTRLTFASVVGKIYLGIHLYNTFNFHGQQTRHPDLWPLWLQIKAPDCRFVSIRFPPFKFCTQNEVIWKQLETLKAVGNTGTSNGYLAKFQKLITHQNKIERRGKKKVIRNPDVHRWRWSEALEWEKDEDFLTSMGGLQIVSKKKWSLIFSKTLLQQYYKYMEITFFFF